MSTFKRIVAYSVFAIQILIAFVLIFESRVEAPPWLQAFGRLHPLLLHLPIGLLIVTTLLYFARRIFESPTFDELLSFFLHLTAITASLSAFMGLLLSLEGGYDTDSLALHKWLGIALSFLCWLLISVRPTASILRPSLILSTVLLVFTGHYGANLTHGENFVFGPLESGDVVRKEITDSTTLFEAAIVPILEAKCYGCHNESKAKGRLVLTSLEKISAGGKNGDFWKAGDPDNSHIMQRLSLPLDHKEHMPPRDKAQLSMDEIVFIEQWLRAGADVKAKYRSLSEADSLRQLASPIVARYRQPEATQKYNFEFASQQKIKELSTPYRTVFQIALNEPALQADFFLSGMFERKHLEELKVVDKQIVAIDLSKMPVGDDDLELLTRFSNLEKLNLNGTKISGETLGQLARLENLKSLSLSGTRIGASSLKALGKSRSLKEVFLWNTGLSDAEISQLRRDVASVKWEYGYRPDENEKLRLSPPFVRNDGQVLKNDEAVMLKHNLPGVVIRYAIDEEIDSTHGPVYEKPVATLGYTLVRARAFKDGWLSSRQAEFIFFRKGVKPDRAELGTQPEKQYPGEGAVTLIDDKKGMPDYYRDPAWMAFRNGPMEAFFYFDKEIPEVKNVTLSFAKNIGAMCMPPASMEVWGGTDKDHLKFLGKAIPEQPMQYVATRIEGAVVEIPPSRFACYKIIARPQSRLPSFRKAGKDKGWLMTDEIFFN